MHSLPLVVWSLAYLTTTRLISGCGLPMYNWQQFDHFTCNQYYLLLAIMGPRKSLKWALKCMTKDLPSFILKAERICWSLVEARLLGSEGVRPFLSPLAASIGVLGKGSDNSLHDPNGPTDGSISAPWNCNIVFISHFDP